jgi:hypothetical protein
LKQAAARLKELRDLGVTDIILAPPVFMKSLEKRKMPVSGRLPYSELVKPDEDSKRYGSLHSIQILTR